MNCQCGLPIQIKWPILILGMTPLHTFIVQIPCSCGRSTNVQLDTMKPYVADRCDVFPAKRGEYQVAPGGGVNFTCPVCKCGFGFKPSTVHTIADDGKVTPSVICPNGCGFHAWVTLKDWKA
jgi:hypothetical protein